MYKIDNVLIFVLFVHTQADQLYNPQPPFSNRGVPAGHVTQQGYAGYPPVPISPQLGTTSQPHIAMTTPLQPLGGRSSSYYV